MSDNNNNNHQSDSAMPNELGHESPPKRTNGELIPTVMGSVPTSFVGQPKNNNGRLSVSLIPDPVALLRSFRRRWLTALVLASLVGYLSGEFVNSFVLAKMKLWTRGRYLWTRTIGSTVAGQAVDTFAFLVIAFFGVWPLRYIVVTALSLYSFKVTYEVLATPATYAVVDFLKKKEGVDTYDVRTNFSPFRWTGY